MFSPKIINTTFWSSCLIDDLGCFSLAERALPNTTLIVEVCKMSLLFWCYNNSLFWHLQRLFFCPCFLTDFDHSHPISTRACSFQINSMVDKLYLTIFLMHKNNESWSSNCECSVKLKDIWKCKILTIKKLIALVNPGNNWKCMYHMLCKFFLTLPLGYRENCL